ncbi:MAG: hypothetical protein HY355_00575 [Armatimonadetes bacterium]|nr:hypothetical protein [Armatimonadota bacterium]
MRTSARRILTVTSTLLALGVLPGPADPGGLTELAGAWWPSGVAHAQTPAPQPAASPPLPECRSQSSGEKPRATTDDIVNCVVERLGPSRVRLTVAYTYASPLGRQNIWLGVDLLAGGNRLKWFGYRPAPINTSSGTASIEIVYGVNNPPPDRLLTDQVEFFLYVGGGQIFYRKLFTFKNEWQL